MIVRNRKSLKKSISLFVVTLLSFSLFFNVLIVNGDMTEKPEYYPDSGKVEYIALSVKASNNIRFTTMGWYPYVEIDGRRYDAKVAIAECEKEDLTHEKYYRITKKVLEEGQAATHFLMPLTETDNSMLEVLKHAYAVNNKYDRQVFDDIENVFFQGKTIYLNAVTKYYS